MTPLPPRRRLGWPPLTPSLTLVLCALSGSKLAGAEPAESPAKGTGKNPQLLVPARVFDAEDGKVHEGWVVLVTSNKIAAVGSEADVKAPPDATTMQLPGMTLLPGLMDIHSHIFLHPYNEALWNDQVLK